MLYFPGNTRTQQRHRRGGSGPHGTNPFLSDNTPKNATSAEQASNRCSPIHGARYIFSDSKAAIRSYSKGRILQVAARILQQQRAPNYRTTKLVWTPAHVGLHVNKQTHTGGCEIVTRAAINPPAAATEHSQKFVHRYRDNGLVPRLNIPGATS